MAIDGADELGLSPEQAAEWRAEIEAIVAKAPPLSEERMAAAVTLLRGGELRPAPRRQPSDAA